MSIKRRFEHQYRRLSAIAGAVDAPAWMMSNFFRVSMIAVVILAGVGYLSKISALSTGGYQLHDLESQVASLQSDIQKNEVQIAIGSSITNIEKMLAGTKMVSVSSLQHIDAIDTAVAKR